MLSRVAADIYWMNRYLERAENYARFVDVNFNLALELHPDVKTQWEPLVTATGDLGLYRELYPTVGRQPVVRFLGFDERNPNSVYNSVLKARENARAIRSEITKEVWEQINQLYFYVREAREQERWTENDPRAYFTDIRKGCQLVWGLYESTIAQSEGWHFSRIGRLVERADKTSRILDIKYLLLAPQSGASPTFDLVQWSALLKSVSAYDMYKKRYGKLAATQIVEFLLFSRRFPRSIFACLLGVDASLRALSPPGDAERLNRAQRKLGQLRSQLEYSDVDEIMAAGVHEYLDRLQADLNDLSTALFETFFSVEVQRRSLHPPAKSMTQEQRGGGQSQSQSQSRSS